MYALSSCTDYLFYENWPVSDLHSNYSAQLSELTDDCHDRPLDLPRGALLSADGMLIHKSAKLDVVSSVFKKTHGKSYYSISTSTINEAPNYICHIDPRLCVHCTCI